MIKSTTYFALVSVTIVFVVGLFANLGISQGGATAVPVYEVGFRYVTWTSDQEFEIPEGFDLEITGLNRVTLICRDASPKLYVDRGTGAGFEYKGGFEKNRTTLATIGPHAPESQVISFVIKGKNNGAVLVRTYEAPLGGGSTVLIPSPGPLTGIGIDHFRWSGRLVAKPIP